MEYVRFNNRSFGFKGDRGTYVSMDTNKVTIVKSYNGIISQKYWDELCEFCSMLGVSFKDLPCGDKFFVYNDELQGIASSLVDELYDEGVEIPYFGASQNNARYWVDAITKLSKLK